MEEALGGSMGSGDVFEAELQHVAALAACASSTRASGSRMWVPWRKDLSNGFFGWILKGFFGWILMWVTLICFI